MLVVLRWLGEQSGAVVGPWCDAINGPTSPNPMDESDFGVCTITRFGL